MKEESKAIIEVQERQIEELKEAAERVQIADKIEVRSVSSHSV